MLIFYYILYYWHENKGCLQWKQTHGRKIPPSVVGTRAGSVPFIMEEVGELDYDHRLFVSVCEAVIDPKEFEYAKWCGNGRPKADRVSIFKAYLLKMTLNLKGDKELVELLRQQPLSRRMCGWGSAGLVPSRPSFCRAGTEVFFRLGQTIEHGPKKYGVLPPKDFAKWARICEQVIRHYNEGWGLDKEHTTRNIAWSNQFNVVYWEIWNEPDLDPSDNENALPANPRCWGGTVTNFFRLYETTAKHLKGQFPNLKIGGPAICGRFDWGERFLAYCHDNSVPLDFFSWHIYATEPKQIATRCRHHQAHSLHHDMFSWTQL